MPEVADRYHRIADGFSRRLAGVRADQWSAATPCTDWSVHDLVVHVVGTQRRVLGSVEGGDPMEVDGNGDLAAQWEAASQAIIDALSDPERAATTVSGMFGDQPFESLVGRMVCADTLLHTWDLARATGQDEELDADAVSTCRAFLAPVDDAIRRPGGFAAKIPSPAGADEQRQLLNFCGRAG